MIFYLFFGMIGLALVCVLAFPLTTRPALAATLLMACAVVYTALIKSPAIQLGVLVYPADVVYVLLFVAAILRYAMQMARLNRLRTLIICLLLLFLLALARGFVRFGMKPAGVECREMFYFQAGILYFSSFNLGARVREKILNVWLGTSLVLTAICILRWLAVLAGLDIAFSGAGELEPGFRVISAQDADILGVAFFASMIMNVNQTGPWWQRKLYYLFGPMVLLLQHRTVWLVMLVGFLWLGMQDKRFRRQAIWGMVTLAILAVVAVAFLFGSYSHDIASALQNSASNEDTFMWRFSGWYQLLFANPARNTLNDIIGQPYGTGFARVIRSGVVDTAPHSHYMDTFLRMGILGMLLWLGSFRAGIRRLKKLPPDVQRHIYPGARFWALVLVLQLAFAFTYSIPFHHSVLTGVALAGLGIRRRKENDPAPDAPPDTAWSARAGGG
ncbi:MAG: O-antigen ligase family protein [Acidobacteriota bacterium]|nr:O-antigen ligase family protein [Acidobacteriota bacterium]